MDFKFQTAYNVLSVEVVKPVLVIAPPEGVVDQPAKSYPVFTIVPTAARVSPEVPLV